MGSIIPVSSLNLNLQEFNKLFFVSTIKLSDLRNFQRIICNFTYFLILQNYNTVTSFAQKSLIILMEIWTAASAFVVFWAFSDDMGGSGGSYHLNYLIHYICCPYWYPHPWLNPNGLSLCVSGMYFLYWTFCHKCHRSHKN